MTAEADLWIAEMKAQAQPCALLHHDQTGASACRLGGLPRIAGRHDWPMVDGRPLTFVCEVDLAALGAVYAPGWLPDSGILHFFYDMVDWPAGFDPADRGHWAVLYSPGPGLRQELAAPPGLSDELMFPQIGITPLASVSHPDPLLLEERLGRRLLDLPDQQWERLQDFRSESEHRPLHQIGGHPSPVQEADLSRECQLVSNGIYLGNPDGYARPEVAALARGASDWRLLLQVDSDDDADMMWGDVGMLYFFIREEDARNRDFAKTWLIMQCS